MAVLINMRNINPNPGQDLLSSFARVKIGLKDVFTTGDNLLKKASVTLAEGANSSSCNFEIYDKNRVYADKYFTQIHNNDGLTPLNPPSTSNGRVTGSSGSADGNLSPNVRAFLDAIAFCEGGEYDVVFGGGKFSSFADHPRPGGRSSASGRYQILAGTYDDIKDDIGVTDFTPQSQDRLAVALIQRRGALDEVEAGNPTAAIALLRNEWTSLPGASQQTKTEAEFLAVYRERLAAYGSAAQSREQVNNSVAIASTPNTEKTPKSVTELGSQITVELGFRGETLTSQSFLHTSLDYDVFAPDSLVFGGQSANWVMTQRIKNTAYINLNLKQIAQKICDSYGLTLEMEGDGPTYEYFPQRGQTDYEALLIEARRIGYRVYCRGRVLTMKPRSAELGFVLEYGDNLGIVFRVRHQAQSDSSGGARSSEPGQMSSTGEMKFRIDPESGQTIATRPENDIGTGQGTTVSTTGSPIPRLAPKTTGATDAADTARRENELRVKGIIAEFEFPTTPEALLLTPDTPFITKGFTKFLDRIWVIEKITHTYDNGNLTTSGTCYSPLKNRFPQPTQPVTSSGIPATNPGGFIRPCTGRFTSGFRTSRRPNHKGADIAAPTGTPIVASATGVVSFTGFDSGGYGNWIEIDHQNGYETRYGHLSRIGVSQGQQVTQGQRIGDMGSSGRSTGPHLHFEVRLNGVPQDPANYIPL